MLTTEDRLLGLVRDDHHHVSLAAVERILGHCPVTRHALKSEDGAEHVLVDGRILGEARVVREHQDGVQLRRLPSVPDAERREDQERPEQHAEDQLRLSNGRPDLLEEER